MEQGRRAGSKLQVIQNCPAGPEADKQSRVEFLFVHNVRTYSHMIAKSAAPSMRRFGALGGLAVIQVRNTGRGCGKFCANAPRKQCTARVLREVGQALKRVRAALHERKANALYIHCAVGTLP